MPDLSIKIGMIAPSKGGKTTLLATTFQEISTILRGNRFQATYSALDVATRDAISRKLDEYSAILRLQDPFAVPSIAGSVQTDDYKFSLNVPHENRIQRFNIWFKDFPGGLLGLSEFDAEIRPFLLDSAAIVVPIASDFLLALADSDGMPDPVLIEKNLAARKSLQSQNIRSILSDWIVRRIERGERPYIAFVPLRCEAYFNDNGGNRDDSERLFQAVHEFYVKPLYNELTEEQKGALSTEIHAIDTYGIVELVETRLYTSPDGKSKELESIFKRRQNLPANNNNSFASKGAFALLVRLLNYEANELSTKLKTRRDELERTIANRTFWEKFKSLFRDSELRELIQTIDENRKLVHCIATFGQLVMPDKIRQRIVSNNGASLAIP